MSVKLYLGFVSLIATLCLSALPGVSAEEPGDVSIEIVTTFDYPGATYTRCGGINDRGDVAGSFYTGINQFRGFVRFRDGRYSEPIEGPNDPESTYATDIDLTPTVCGYYWDVAAAVFHGYFITGKTVTFYDLEGAGSTSIGGMNGAGHFAGSYGLFAYDDEGCYINANGQVTTFSIPGAAYHRVTAINNADMVVGWVVTTPTIYHGFFRNAHTGEVTYLDVPQSISTLVTGVNDKRVMVGWYWDNASSIAHGFISNHGLSFVSYDYPGSGVYETYFEGINNRGLICGDYTDASGNHGFIARIR
jgi:hypothetical protein